MTTELVAPFPWFGGKRTVAGEVWSRLGDVRNYVEPFFGSGAVLLGRPGPFDGPETVNDADGFLANFWRAVKSDPEAVAYHADWPVSEKDLEARHYWLITDGRRLTAEALADPEWFDAKVAGWWVWGLCSWIGDGWCSGEGPWSLATDGSWADARQLPHLSAGMGINRKLPHLSAGRGINRKLPHLGSSGMGDRLAAITEWLAALSDRLRHVRVACGDWSRVCGPSVTTKHGMTGVFLDPPYGDGAVDYSAGGNATMEVASQAAAWAIENGNDPLLRIAFCGYAGNHTFPDGWTEWAWKARGGYGSQSDGAGRDNAHRERIWFSPHCLSAEMPPLLALMGVNQ